MKDYYLLSKYIASIYRYSKNQINQHISELNIQATQGDLLLFIDEHPHLAQKLVAQQMQIDPSLLGRDLSYLEGKKMGQRVPSKSDSRMKEIIITKKGHRTAESVRQKMNQWWSSFFAGNEEIDGKKLLKQMNQIYQKTLPKGGDAVNESN